jgi:beta-lactamase superfamily II metal-dependent hydrolase
MPHVDIYSLNNHGRSESHVVWFPSSRFALVIDCGSDGRRTVQCLRQLGPKHIKVIFTHLEKDHCGGATAVLAEFEQLIDSIYFKTDKSDAVKVPAVAYIIDRLKGGNLPIPRSLQVDDKPKQLHREAPQGVKIGASLLAPNVLGTAAALAAEDPNMAGGVVRVYVGKFTMLFGDDVPMKVWKKLAATLKLRADVFVIPHHGAPVECASYGFPDLANAVKPNFAIVSVGTTNGYDHPSGDAIRAFRNAGARVLCTQITDKCRRLLDPWVQRHVLPPHGELDNSGTGSNCMGTVAIRMSDSGISVYRLDEHAAALTKSLPDRLCV